MTQDEIHMPDMMRCLPDVGLLLAMLSECSNQLMNVDPLVQQTAGYGVQHLCVCVGGGGGGEGG